MRKPPISSHFPASIHRSRIAAAVATLGLLSGPVLASTIIVPLTNQLNSNDRLALIDSSTNTPSGSLTPTTLNAALTGDALTLSKRPGTTQVWFGQYGQPALGIVDPANNNSSSIVTGVSSNVQHLVFDRNGNKAYLSAFQNLEIVDAANSNSVTSVAVCNGSGDALQGKALNHDDSVLYILCQKGKVYAYDTSNGGAPTLVVDTNTPSSDSSNIAYTPAQGSSVATLWIASTSGGLRSYPLSGASPALTSVPLTSIPVGAQVNTVIADPDGTRVFAGDSYGNVYIIPATNPGTANQTKLSIGISSNGVMGLGRPKDGNRLFVVLRNGITAVVDLSDTTQPANTLGTNTYGTATSIYGNFLMYDSVAPTGAPGTPTASPMHTAIRLDFSAATSDNPFNGYRASCTPQGGGSAITNMVNGTVTHSITVSGLTNGTTYDCEVWAFNSSGNSPHSGTVSATPISGPVVNSSSVSSSIYAPGSRAPRSNATQVSFALVFSEAMSGLTAGNLTLTPSGTATGTVGTPTSTDNITWTVPVSNISGNGSLRLDLSSTSGITATASGNAALAQTYASGTPWTVGPTSPLEPSISSATSSDQQIELSFTPPTDDGGSSITGYTARCSDGVNVAPTATGTASPLTVSGLSNGTQYTCDVRAENAQGNSDYSTTIQATPSTTVAVIPGSGGSSGGSSGGGSSGGSSGGGSSYPTVPVNPADSPSSFFGSPVTGSTPFDTLATLQLQSGFTTVPANTSFISNFAELGGNVAISSSGVMLVKGGDSSRPVTLSDTMPAGIILALQENKPIVFTIGGNALQVLTGNEPLRDGNGKVVSTLFATAQLPGITGPVLNLVSGQAELTAPASGSGTPLLALNYNGGGTGANAPLTVNASGGSVASVARQVDGSAAISALSGELQVTLPSTSANRVKKGGFAADSGTQITLKAGEVLRLNNQGQLLGVYVGSLSGSAGKPGDSLHLSTPGTALARYPSRSVQLAGGSVGRLGDTLLAGLTGDASATQDASTGIVRFTSAGRSFSVLPLGEVTVTPEQADGMVWLNDGTFRLTRQGLTLSATPMVGNPAELAEQARRLGYTTQILDNGSIKLTGSNQILLAQPRATVAASASTAGFQWDEATGRASFADSTGQQQLLDPVFWDLHQLEQQVTALGEGWQLERDAATGGYRLSSKSGQRFMLEPSYLTQVVNDGKSSGVYMDAQGQLNINYATGFLPMVQQVQVR